jgi:hypothetical protein
MRHDLEKIVSPEDHAAEFFGAISRQVQHAQLCDSAAFHSSLTMTARRRPVQSNPDFEVSRKKLWRLSCKAAYIEHVDGRRKHSRLQRCANSVDESNKRLFLLSLQINGFFLLTLQIKGFSVIFACMWDCLISNVIMDLQFKIFGASHSRKCSFSDAAVSWGCAQQAAAALMRVGLQRLQVQLQSACEHCKCFRVHVCDTWRTHGGRLAAHVSAQKQKEGEKASGSRCRDFHGTDHLLSAKRKNTEDKEEEERGGRARRHPNSAVAAISKWVQLRRAMRRGWVVLPACFDMVRNETTWGHWEWTTSVFSFALP